MITPRRQINELVAKIKSLSLLLDFKAREIGRLLASVPDASVESVELAGLFKAIRNIEAEIPERIRISDKIKKLVASMEAAKAENQEARREMREKEAESRTLAEKAGQDAFGIYKRNPGLKDYEDLFAQLLRLDEIAQAEMEKSHHGNQPGRTPLSQLINTARSIYSIRVRQANESRYLRAYEACGKALAASDFRMEAKDPGLDETIEALLAIELETGQLKEKEAAFSEKKKRYSSELAQLGVKGSVFLRIRELEKELKMLDVQLGQKHGAIGKMYIDNPNVIEVKASGMEKLLADATELSKDSALCSQEIGKIEAGIEIDAIKEKIKKSQSKIRNLERSIRKNEEEIEAQKNKVSRLEREKQRFEKIAKGK